MSPRERFALAAVVSALLAFPAHASNLGFKLERPLNNVLDSWSLYFVSFPYHRSFHDIAGDPSDVQTPNGVIDSADVLLDWYTNGDGCCPGDLCDNGQTFPDECDGIITLFTFDPDPATNPSQRFQTQTIRRSITGDPALIGNNFPVEDPSDPKSNDDSPRGYMVQAVSGEFPSMTVGSHNPQWTEWVLTEYADSRNLNLFSLPYHTTFTKSSELLVAAWDDAEGNEIITIFDFDPDPVTNPDQRFTTQTIRHTFPSGYALIPDSGFDCGDGFCLTPGNGYLIQVTSGGTDGVVRVPLPHF